MKKIFLFPVLILLTALSVHANDDTQVIDALVEDSEALESADLKMQSFESCQAFEEVMEWYIQDYWGSSYRWRGNIWIQDDMILEDMSLGEARVSTPEAGIDMADWLWWGGTDFSDTNLQVMWVDESDIAKTDGRYIYTYSDDKNSVYILETWSNWDLREIKKILLPKNFWWVELFVQEDRLIVIAGSHRDNWGRWYFIDRNSQSYAIVYDISDITTPELIRLSSIEWNISQTRMIWDTLYMLTNNYFNVPYHTFWSIDEISIRSQDILPQKLDLVKSDSVDTWRQLILWGEKLPYTIERWAVTDCSSIMYHFPSKDTLKEIPFSPSYTIITAIDTRNASTENTTQVIAGSNSQIHMSLNNLYMTEWIYFSSPWSCPRGMACIMPMFRWWSQNTLIHKFNIDGMNLRYQDTWIVSGSPLTQYSMDEYQGNFRIITSEWQAEPSTSLHILDNNLNKVSSLTDLAPGETFQWSRFIWEKLFLVTFELIDPLFVIDVANPRNPQVLWELKIPGYSTYLHPYDDIHLIGLWYDTDINDWGGLEMKWVKLDLYKIHYDKQCWDSGLTQEMIEKCASGDYKWIIVEQLHTKTFWGRWSHSEATYNPRMFIWNANRDTLLLPMQLMQRDANWRLQDFYNGAFAIEISPQGIHEIARTSHIDLDIQVLETERKKACEPFFGNSGEPVCRTLINGDVICDNLDTRPQRNIPNYCYEDSSIWTYIGDRSWEYSTSFIQRTLYAWDTVYTLSQDRVRSHNWKLQDKFSLELR